MNRVFLSTMLPLALLAASLDRATAGSWPQVLGPSRNGVAENEKLADSWPEDGPAELWKRSVGSGFAGPAVAGGRVVVFHRLGDEEVVEAAQAASGKRLWRESFPTNYVCTIVRDSGPRCVPLIHDGRVYVHGAEGRLACLNLADGKVLWQRRTAADFGLPPSYFGAGSTPIVAGGKLLVNVGGRDGAGIVAFNLENGKTVWKSTDAGPSYSSPVAATVEGSRHVIFATRLEAISVDPRDGGVRFRFPFGKRGPTVNGATPVLIGKHAFFTASYGIGAKVVLIGDDGAENVWEGDDTLSSQYPTPVLHDGALYGIHGRQDVGLAALRAVDPLSGKVHWSEDEFGMASCILADGKLILVTTDGEVVLAEPSREEYRELARARITDETTRALPALSDGRLYVRGTTELKCFDLSVGTNE